MKRKVEVAIISKQYLILLIIAISIFLVIGGISYYRSEREAIIHNKHDEIKTVADLKISQIVQWRKERIADIDVVAKSPFLVYAIEKWLNGKNSKKLKDDILKTLIPIKAEYGYAEFYIISTSGEILLSLDHQDVKLNEYAAAKAADAVKLNKLSFTDFYFCKIHNKIHYDLIEPVVNERNIPIAVLLFRVDPEGYFFPLIKSWPTASKTSETLIVRRESDSVLFLNDLRMQNNTALKLRFPISNKELPAVQAVLGFKGIFEGKDYRGVQVLADIEPIPDTPWFMVAKVDNSEIYSELRFRAIIIGLFTFALIVLLIIGMSLIFKQRQKKLYQQLLIKEKELWANQEEFKTTLYSIGDAVLSTDVNGIVTQMNPAAEQLTGWTESKARGNKVETVFNIINEDTRTKVESPVDKVLKEGHVVGLANHTLLISMNGKETPIADSGAPIKDELGEITGVVLVFRDQTDERNAQEALRKSELANRQLVQNLHAGVVVHAPDSTIILANDQASKLLGLTVDQMMGKTAIDPEWCFVREDETPMPIEEYPVQYVLDKRVPLRDFVIGINRPITKDLTWVLANAFPEFNSDKTINQVVVTFIDITERKHFEEALRKSEKQVQRKLDAILSPELDIGTIELVDVIDVEKIQKLMDEFYKATNMTMAILDLSGNILVAAGWQDICTKFHRISPESCRMCKESDTELSSNVPNGTFKMYRCKNNMWDTATPIMLGEKHVGNLFLGQFIFDDEVINYETFRQQSKRYGFDELEYIAALDRVPRFKKEAVNAIMSFYGTFAKMLSDLSYSNIKLASTLEGRKQAEEETKKNEARLNRAEIASKSGNWELNLDSKIMISSEGAQKIYGVEKDQFNYAVIKNIPLPEYRSLLDAALKGLIEEDKTYDVEFKIKTADNGEIKVIHSIAIIDKEKKVLFGIIQDITDRKSLENEIERERLLLKDLINTQPEGIYRLKVRPAEQWTADNWNAEMRSLYSVELVSDRFCDILGITKNDFIINPALIPDLILPEDSANFNQQNANAINTKTTFRWEGRITIKGDVRWIYFESIPRDIGNGEMIWTGVIQDITERKKVEEELILARKLSDSLISNLPGVFYLFNSEGKFLRWNQNFENVSGYSSEEFAKISPLDLFQGGERQLIDQHIQKVFNEGSTEVEAMLTSKEGKTISYYFTGHKIEYDHKHYLIGVGFDISARKLAEEELKESEVKFRNLFEHSPVGKSMTGIDGTLNVNKAFCNLLGYSEEELTAKKWMEISHPDDIRKTSDYVTALLKGNIINARFEKRYIHKNGSTIWTDISTYLQKDKDGKPLYFITAILDMTERKRAEEERVKLFNIIDNSLNEIYIFNSTTLRFEFVNQGALQNIGYTLDEMKKITPVEIKPEFTKSGFRKKIEALLTGEQKMLNFSTIHRRKDGSTYPVDIHLQLFNQENKKVFFAIINDITEHKRAEAKIREKDVQFRKLSSNLPDLIFQFTRKPDGTYIVPIASEGIKNIFGCSPEDVVDDFGPIGRVIFPEDAARVISDIEYSAEHLTYFTCEFRVQIPGKPIQWILSRSTPEKLADGSITWYGFNADITKRKEAEEKIKCWNEELEQIVKQRTSELNETIEELEQQSKVFVGRELRMIELKEQIAELEKKIAGKAEG